MKPLRERIQNNHMVAIDPDSYRKLLGIQYERTSNIARPTIKGLLGDAINLLEKEEYKNGNTQSN
jgi:hypothetical protein